jgi:hypothetical protein
MSETLSGTVSALRQAENTLAGAEDRLLTLAPGAEAFGAGGPGRLGELGRDLHRRWQLAIEARGREAAAHAGRLQETADAVSRAARGYGDVDASARQRHPEVS